ncbi:MAG: hypothetical protein DME58_07255 [Verrucomicrobia bacterium]|nr:MAG: hypothetical protein DME58_07255 [Verrucomicrobiota bacterium]
MRTRSTIEVLEDHLERRERGDIESDLEHNYPEEVVLLCEHGALKGRDAVRNSAKALVDQLPARFGIRSKQWTARTPCCIGARNQQARMSTSVWIRLSSATVGLFYKPFLIS